jgi:hypothetical protein
MAKHPTRKTPQHDSDYDGAWKETLRRYFAQVLAKYFPALSAEIDWSVEPQWCDKELTQVLGKTGRRNRRVDVLVKVQLLSGRPQWILVHLEVQTGYEEGFEQRISRYNSGLYWIFNERVVTLVVLADLRDQWRPAEDLFQLAGFESRLRFPVCKLIDHVDSTWRDDHSLPVEVARAQVAALRTASDPEGRYQSRGA